MTIHGKQHYEKEGLKNDNPKDVKRKRLEQRFKAKTIRLRLEKLAQNGDFIDYMYELLALCGYFTPGEGRVNGECYEKKGKLMIANKIADDLTFMTVDGMGIDKINKIRRELHSVGISEVLEEG